MSKSPARRQEELEWLEVAKHQAALPLWLGQTNQPKDLWDSRQDNLVQWDLASHATQPVSNVPLQLRVKVDVSCDIPAINAGPRSPIHRVGQ